MNLKNVVFEEIKGISDYPNYTKKYANIEYDYEGNLIPLELVLIDYKEDNETDKGYEIEIHQGGKYQGDIFDDMEKALNDLQFRIEDLFENGYLEAKNNLYLDY